MWDAATVLAVTEPFGKAWLQRGGYARHLVEGHDVRPDDLILVGARLTECVEHVSQLGVLGRAVGGDNFPKRCRLRRWRLWVEVGQVDARKIRGDGLVTAIRVPA